MDGDLEKRESGSRTLLMASPKPNGCARDTASSHDLGDATSLHLIAALSAQHARAQPEPIREEDRLLPKASVARLMYQALPPGTKITHDSKHLMQELVSEFIRPFKAFNSKWIEIKAKYTVEIYSRNRLLAFFLTFGKENVSIHMIYRTILISEQGRHEFYTRPTSLNI